MDFKKALEDLYVFIEDMQSASKKLTRTKMVSSAIPISTISKFHQSKREKGFKFTVTTLYKIAKRIDSLNKKNDEPTTYAKDLEKIIKRFIKNYILVDKRSKLAENYNLKFWSLERMYNFNIRKTSISIVTLIEYAEAVQYQRPLKSKQEGNN
ncbi:hypothetical protein [Staphylococcus succinus]|uniref:hypothetical protein n=1 Tax=Staphylococcus succinus TaxID=61015 RepID=UPI000E676878|nr:hypothetical protein [Staphylococcus succinus]RIN27720.1 hypothetical protein BU067_01555 [Staphylococcus succinus]